MAIERTKDNPHGWGSEETRKALQYRGEKGIQPKNQANFQVAFENLPEDWNYLIPKVQIARITFHY